MVQRKNSNKAQKSKDEQEFKFRSSSDKGNGKNIPSIYWMRCAFLRRKAKEILYYIYPLLYEVFVLVLLQKLCRHNGKKSLLKLCQN